MERVENRMEKKMKNRKAADQKPKADGAAPVPPPTTGAPADKVGAEKDGEKDLASNEHPGAGEGSPAGAPSTVGSLEELLQRDPPAGAPPVTIPLPPPAPPKAAPKPDPDYNAWEALLSAGDIAAFASFQPVAYSPGRCPNCASARSVIFGEHVQCDPKAENPAKPRQIRRWHECSACAQRYCSLETLSRVDAAFFTKAMPTPAGDPDDE